MLDVDDYARYESPNLIAWKKFTEEEQLNKVVALSHDYLNKLDITKVKDQSIEVSLFMNKNDVYDFLIEYESTLRERLGNFPIIILLKDRADENRKRK